MEELSGRALQKVCAVCCMSGGYKSVFTQGVLQAFEEHGFRAAAYAGCSSSALIAAFAACGRESRHDLSMWHIGYQMSLTRGNSQSEAMLDAIRGAAPELFSHLWRPSSSRLLIATTLVTTLEGASITQGPGARRFGQRLLIEALRRQTAWRDGNLQLRMFDTRSSGETEMLSPANFEQVAYASTRMLHAWDIPAEIDGCPYIDGSYTCLCPVLPMAALGYDRIIAILTETEDLRVDLFSAERVPERYGSAQITFIRPDIDLKRLGVSHYAVTEEGLDRAFRHGYEKGARFIETYE